MLPSTLTYEQVVWRTGPPAVVDSTTISKNREIGFLIQQSPEPVSEIMTHFLATGHLEACAFLLPTDTLQIFHLPGFPIPDLNRFATDGVVWSQQKELWMDPLLVLPVRILENAQGLLLCVLAEAASRSAVVQLGRTYSMLIEKEIQLAQSRQRLNTYSVSLQRKNREFFEKNQFSSNMLSITTHDLSSPLNAVDGYLNLLVKQMQVEDSVDHLTKYVQHITSGMNDIVALFKQLQNITDVQTGRFKLHMAEFDANWIVTDLMEFLSPLTERQGKVMTLQSSDHPVHIHVDLPMIRRVLTNIIMNAVKYTGEQGQISLRIETEGSQAHIRITDNGIGIPLDKQVSIFEPFIRLSNTAAQQDTQSKGLGLFIAAYLCKEMGGGVTVSSELGKGSTFTVSFPLK